MQSKVRKEERVKYLALIYGDATRWDSLSDDERSRIYADYMAFGDAGRKAGVVIGGAELAGVQTATTVRVRDGQTAVTDGPYAETKEQLGGFYLIECADRDEAVEYAKRIPRSPGLAVEIRAVPSH
jgi:hypothetical protein